MKYTDPAPFLATDLWMLCHDTLDRRPLAHPSIVRSALAAALLGELLLTGRIDVDDGALRPLSGPPPDDWLSHRVLDQLRNARQLSVRTWVQASAQTAYDAVAERLVRLHLVRPAEQRRLLVRREVVYLPFD